MFIRRFLADPGDDVLLEIESVNILDLEPPAAIVGVGAGTTLCIGEFEDGAFETPTEVTSPEDMSANFGTLGYTYAGVVANNCSAVGRKADGALTFEYWNGNAFVQLSGKKFSRLILQRVDTSVGSVTFTALPYILGASAFSFDIEPSQILGIDIGGGSVSSTFTATAATVTGIGGVYPSTFTGGETLTIGYDNSTLHPNFTVTFLSTDQTAAQVSTRINLFAGFALTDVSGGQIRFTGQQRGSGGQIRIVSGSTGVLTKLGLTAANTAGTGNVANIDAVTPTEINTIVSAAVPTAKVEQLSDGTLRLSTTSASLTITSATTATALGFVSGTVGAAAPVAGTIPAGTVVQTAGAVKFVTMATTKFVAGAGTYSVKIRHATDDGTGVSALAAAVAVIPTPIDSAAFSVLNPQIVTAALTEAQIDAQYALAFDKTLDVNTVAREVNLMFSARQSNAVRIKGRANAIAASATGMFGRIFFTRPPLGTLKAVAQSTTLQPGVGAYRDQRVVYNYPGARTFVPLIARRGTLGGAGFTADGNVDVGADGFCASCCSQLNPEENPGQETNFLSNVIGLESSANVVGLTIVDYTNFKKAGICALRMDGGKAVFQSGVTSVDPIVNAALATIKRRRMADFIQDTLALAAKKFGKKLNTFARRKSIRTEIEVFLAGLKSDDQPDNARIADYSISEKQNTVTSLGRGLYRLSIRVQTLSSLDSLAFTVTAGEQVTVEEDFSLAA